MQNQTDSELWQQLAELLDTKAENGRVMRSDEVQAFMMAIASGPDALAETDWQPEVLGEGPFDETERQAVIKLCETLFADIKTAIAGKKLPDLWLYQDEAGNADVYTWCNAYLYALDIVPTDWFETADQEEFEDLFYPIMALGGIYDEEENGEVIVHFSDKELIQLEAELPQALLEIALYWHAVINKPTTVRREGGKIGRNDPCPCSSGKKYKACCGKN
ncbi:YecA family protein [Neisseria sp. ZJ106]|uniref:YecA family protein n=1 Tax=Neisseria lisongii TaxID=2912188 RepID=A0ABY7RJS3_9NEIS|nr:YecA family protein [Neisseria lisongii]MCF7522070.1 YecA family protein [Neisseria lisongii]WCL71867.1 YecA family protein [Neisseria lisongii]